VTPCHGPPYAEFSLPPRFRRAARSSLVPRASRGEGETMTPPADAYLAFSRFGLGPRPGDLAALAGDPKAAVVAELADPTALFLDDSGLPSSVDAYAQVRQFQRLRKMEKQQASDA